jgi:hypothetical protein
MTPPSQRASTVFFVKRLSGPIAARRDAVSNHLFVRRDVPFICAFRDDLGMKGTVIVRP